MTIDEFKSIMEVSSSLGCIVVTDDSMEASNNLGCIVVINDSMEASNNLIVRQTILQTIKQNPDIWMYYELCIYFK